MLMIFNVNDSNKANQIGYDNANSALAADNVQGAIDEVNNKSELIVVSNLSPQTEVLGTNQNPQSDGTFAPTIADGYKVLGVISTYPTGTGSSGVASFAYYDESDGLVHYRLNNTRTTVAKITLNVRMLCQHE